MAFVLSLPHFRLLYDISDLWPLNEAEKGQKIISLKSNQETAEDEIKA